MLLTFLGAVGTLIGSYMINKESINAFLPEDETFEQLNREKLINKVNLNSLCL